MTISGDQQPAAGSRAAAGDGGNGAAPRQAPRVSPLERGAPVVVEVSSVEKTFRIPTHRINSFKERAVHPFARPEFRELQALRELSFEIRQGEFFGIVGRNGSGKSTLLKILAGIYRADAGRVRMAGRVSPFIELGVGFSMEFTARENVVLTGVMMGLSPRQARSRLDAVLEFAELEEFVDLKLKNYSSGMLVRLAFAAMVQADADILLIDEVLAVGDASFQQKCLDVFHEQRAAGKTIVLVTHDMTTVEEFCDRAMLIHDGELRFLGDPEEVGRRYFRLNFGGISDERPQADFSHVEGDARIRDAWIVNGANERAVNVEQRDPIRIRAIVEAVADIRQPGVGFLITNVDGIPVYGFGSPLQLSDGQHGALGAGERLRVAATIENRLAPGRYYVTALVCRNANMTDVVLRIPNVLDFVVYGTHISPGVVSLRSELEAFPEDEAGGEAP
jgi:ABC-type polysaccharide/polyol phosphate transport system ATPase subunit